MAKLIQDYPYQLKYVVSSPMQFVEIEDLHAELMRNKSVAVDPSRVYIMAEGRSTEELQKREKDFVIEMCKNRGWNWSPRAQIWVYGDTKNT